MTHKERELHQAAEQLWASGAQKESLRMHLQLVTGGHDPDVSLQSAIMLIPRLNPIGDLKTILEVSAIAIQLARKLNDAETTSYFEAIKAKHLAISNGALVLAQKNLTMAPLWIGFSLEHDKREFEELQRRINANNAEVDQLSRDALDTCREPSTRGHVRMLCADVFFQRYADAKIRALHNLPPIPAWLRQFLTRCSLDEHLWYRRSDRRLMHSNLKSCENNYLQAIAEFADAREDSNLGRAHYNLANNLRSANHFLRARRHLRQAERIARRIGDEDLLRSIKVLGERIRSRNRNVPNYTAAEQ